MFRVGGEKPPRKDFEGINNFEFDDKIHAFIDLGLEWNRQIFGSDRATFAYDEPVGEWTVALGPLWGFDPGMLSVALFYPDPNYREGERVVPQRIDIAEFNAEAFREDIESLLRQPSRASVATIFRTFDGVYTADNLAQATEVIDWMAEMVSGETLEQIRTAGPRNTRAQIRDTERFHGYF